MMSEQDANTWTARDKAHVLHGFTDVDTFRMQGPVVLTHGEGIRVFDVHGRAYIDANSGLWNNFAGFSHQGIIDALCDQARTFPGYHAFFGRIADTTVALSEKLIALSPFDEGKVYVTNSGSEANDSMVKMLWMLHRHNGQPQRRKIITHWNGYHGATIVAASMTGKAYNENFGLPLPGFLHVDCPHYWRYGEDGETEAQFSVRLARQLEETVVKEGPDTIAGMFAEPVLGAGGVIPPPAGYFESVRPILARYGIPLIADEVISGFGRTGVMWGSEKYSLEPDAIIASKCLTAGYFPMAAVILGKKLGDELMCATSKLGEFPHGFTAGGNPLGSAVALKALEVIEQEALLANVNRVSPRFMARLQQFGEHELAGEVRGVGLMGAVELVADKATKEPLPETLRITERIATTALEKGLICRPLGEAIVLAPPFIISENDIDEIFDILEATMRDVAADAGI